MLHTYIAHKGALVTDAKVVVGFPAWVEMTTTG
jgi:hypothetical protein